MSSRRVRVVFAIVAWTVWATAMLQILYRGDPVAAFSTLHVTLGWWGIELLACAGVVVSAPLLGRRSWLVLPLLSPLALLAVAAGAKRRFLGESPRWSDLSLLPEAWSVVSVRDLLSWSALIALASLLVIGWVLRRRLPLVVPTNARERLLAGLVTLFAWSLCALQVRRVLAASAQDPAWRARGGGIVGDVVAQLDSGRLERSANLRAALGMAREYAAATEASSVRPHVIVVLSESFWDPTLLPKVHFERDPLPTYHALKTRFPSGMMLTPQFGGGTANVEFEVLTGIPMRFLPEGALAYTESLKGALDSIAAILRRSGWTATAISPWPSWYTNANRAYRNLGFDRFVSGEFLPADIKGKYLPDDAIAEEILARVEHATEPQLVFANTSENHFPFPPHKFEPGAPLGVSGLDPEMNAVVESYAQGVADADAMLAKLVARLGALKAPTMLVWFGDHLPALPVKGAASMTREQILAIYEAAGWVENDRDPRFLDRMHRTPVIVWDNFLGESHDDLSFSACHLGAYALTRARLPTAPYMAFLAASRESMPLLPPRWSTVAVPRVRQAELRALARESLTGFALGMPDGGIVSPGFEVGPGPLKLVRPRKVTSDGARWTVALETSNAPPRVHANADGTRVESIWIDPEHVTVQVDAVRHPPGTKVMLELFVPSLVASAPPQEGDEVMARSNKLEIVLAADGQVAP